MLSFVHKLIGTVCLSCESYSEKSALCSNCLNNLDRCGKFSKKPEPNWRTGFAGFHYSGPVVDLIYSLKYKKGSGLISFIANQMKAIVSEVERPDIVVPVPLAKYKLLKRGYNQSYEFAKECSKIIQSRATANVLECSKTMELVGRSRVERAFDVKGIYKMKNQEKVRGKNVLLVDDVMTTGATLSECTKVLKKAGAKYVDILVIAKA